MRACRKRSRPPNLDRQVALRLGASGFVAVSALRAGRTVAQNQVNHRGAASRRRHPRYVCGSSQRDSQSGA
jgi:hypothetical protein